MEDSQRKEFYSINDAEAQRIYVGVRRAKEWVGFSLPHLKKGMHLLDCGCGVGSITLDLAELVAPGPVIGLDMDESQLEIARQNAGQRGLTNVTFEQGIPTNYDSKQKPSMQFLLIHYFTISAID